MRQAKDVPCGLSGRPSELVAFMGCQRRVHLNEALAGVIGKNGVVGAGGNGVGGIVRLRTLILRNCPNAVSSQNIRANAVLLPIFLLLSRAF